MGKGVVISWVRMGVNDLGMLGDGGDNGLSFVFFKEKDGNEDRRDGLSSGGVPFELLYKLWSARTLECAC